MRGDYGKRDDYFDRFVPGEGEGSALRAAVANGVIAPGVEGEIFFADATFTEDATKPGQAWNDSAVPIPDGTGLYVGRVSPLPGWRIVQAFVCTVDEAYP